MINSYRAPTFQPLSRLRTLFQFPAGAESPEQAKLFWLVKLRWAALTLAFLAVAPAASLGYLSPGRLPSLMGMLSCYGIINLLLHLHAGTPGARTSGAGLALQMAADLLALGALLNLAGGSGGPFALIFYFYVALGGILLAAAPSWIFLLVAHLVLLSLQALESAAPAAPALVLAHLLLFCLWSVMHFLGRHLDQQHQSLLAARAATARQDRLRALGALAAGFSHEFASPLQTLRLKLDRLARERSEPDLQIAREAVEACSLVLERMNQSQLDFSSAQAQPVDLAQLTAQLVRRWEQEHGTKVELASPGRLLTSLPTLGFAQALLNLLDNARDASLSTNVKLALSSHEGTISLSVADSGPGFTPDHLARVGEPFFSKKPHGTGLGLYVCDLFCQNLGGEMKVRNRPAGGAEVILAWPRRMA